MFFYGGIKLKKKYFVMYGVDCGCACFAVSVVQWKREEKGRWEKLLYGKSSTIDVNQCYQKAEIISILGKICDKFLRLP